MAAPWWESWPGRLDHELTSLTNAGIAFQVDDEARLTGIVRLHLKVALGDRSIPLVVTFPDLYPFFRFEVAAPNEDLLYHQNPLSKRLCLLGRATINWDSRTTVASAITEQLPRVLHTSGKMDRASVAEVEEHQAEPIGDFYPLSGPRLVMILVDSSWRLPLDEASGTLLVGLQSEEIGLHGTLQGAVLEVRSNAGKVLKSADPSWARMCKARTFTSRWIRVPAPIRVFDPREFFDLVQQKDPGRSGNIARAIGDVRLQLWGVVFPEEFEWRGEQGDGWIFVCRFTRKVTSLPPGAKLSPLTAAKSQQLWKG